mgnify:CR=1 FL=1
MLRAALLAGAERGINRVLRLDPTALPRLARLSGRVIEIDCMAPAWRLFILADDEGLRLAGTWGSDADCRLRAPASSLLRLAVSRNKTAVLHGPDVEIEGDSGLLMNLAEVLQDLELDWEYEISRWLGPVGAQLLGSSLRNPLDWLRDSAGSLRPAWVQPNPRAVILVAFPANDAQSDTYATRPKRAVHGLQQSDPSHRSWPAP